MTYPILPSPMDLAASEGIWDFDAEAYIKGKPARYVGAPKIYIPFEQPLMTYQPSYAQINPYMQPQPHRDVFVKKPTDWRKLLVGGTIVAAIAALATRNGSKISNFVKKITKSKATRQAEKEAAKEAAKETAKKASSQAAPNAITKTSKKHVGAWLKNAKGKFGNWFKGLKKWKKGAVITGAVILGLWVLGRIRAMFRPRAQQQ